MFAKSIYPKTKRVSDKMIVTEKLDGSNLTIFKGEDDHYVCTRNCIFTLTEILENGCEIRGLQAWLTANQEEVRKIHSAVCGEWMGMGKIDYGDLEKKFYLFAKGRVNLEKTELYGLTYDPETLHFAFMFEEIPPCFGVVPTVIRDFGGGLDVLETLYQSYIKEVPHPVEGFVISNPNDWTISKFIKIKARGSN